MSNPLTIGPMVQNSEAAFFFPSHRTSCSANDLIQELRIFLLFDWCLGLIEPWSQSHYSNISMQLLVIMISRHSVYESILARFPFVVFILVDRRRPYRKLTRNPKLTESRKWSSNNVGCWTVSDFTIKVICVSLIVQYISIRCTKDSPRGFALVMLIVELHQEYLIDGWRMTF